LRGGLLLDARQGLGDEAGGLGPGAAGLRHEGGLQGGGVNEDRNVPGAAICLPGASGRGSSIKHFSLYRGKHCLLVQSILTHNWQDNSRPPRHSKNFVLDIHIHMMGVLKRHRSSSSGAGCLQVHPQQPRQPQKIAGPGSISPGRERFLTKINELTPCFHWPRAAHRLFLRSDVPAA
jgi:hypothetical protein